MRSPLRNLTRLPALRGWALLLLAGVWSAAVSAKTVALHLKSGDQISGLVVSETTNQVVISNAWTKALAIPLSEITKRVVIKSPKPPAPRPAPKPAARPPKAPAKKPKPARAKAVAAAKPVHKPPPKPKGTWHGQINVGFDAIYGTRDQKNYSGHANFTYVRPFPSRPNKFFRNTTQLGAEYQNTHGQESANRANGSNKSDFDLWDSFYAYGLVGAGYDDVRKINFHYQIGPGGGAHLIRHKNFVLDAEAGMDYEMVYRRDISDLETFYFRLAEDATWKIRKNLTWSENIQFYPDMERMGQHHADFTSTLSFGFWEYLSLNLTAVDHYNTELPPGVPPNQFEFRSSLGFTF